MPISLYDTRTMLQMLEITYSPETFLLKTFFKDGEQADGQYIDIDIVKGGRRLPVIVRPTGKGTPMKRGGHTTRSIKTPYIKPKIETSAEDLLKRQPGNVIYAGNVSPAMMAERQLAKDLKTLQDLAMRFREWQAASALQTGKIQMVGDGISQEVDFLMPADHIVALLGTDRWSDTANSDPVRDLRTWRRKISRDSGLVPPVAILGEEVVEALYNNTKVLAQLDNRRVVMGKIEPMLLPEGVVYLGNLAGIDIYSYDSYYEDAAGDLWPMVDPKKIIIGSTNSRAEVHHGAILDLAVTVKAKEFAKPLYNQVQEENIVWMMLQTGPLCALHQPDAFMVITAVA